MTQKINSYFAVLLITITGAAASLLIIHIIYANTFVVLVSGNEAIYASAGDY